MKSYAVTLSVGLPLVLTLFIAGCNNALVGNVDGGDDAGRDGAEETAEPSGADIMVGAESENLDDGDQANGQILVYQVTNPVAELQASASCAGGANHVPLKFEKFEYSDRARWKTYVARLAADCPLQLQVDLGSPPTMSELRSPTQVLETNRSGNTISFQLPGAGNYVLKSNDSTDPIETIVFFVDDYNRLVLSAPLGAIVAAVGQDLQALVDQAANGSVIYLSPGVFELDHLLLNGRQGLTLLFHPDAVLKQNSDSSNFVDILGSTDIEFSGPGHILTPINNTKTSFEVKDCSNIRLSDFLLHKAHEADGWTLHLYSSSDLTVRNVRIISGNDGTDPDSSQNVTYDGVYVESQDDAVAVKTRSNEEVRDLTIKNCFAKSAASALKIGESTVKRRIDNVVFSDCTIYDSDRGMVVTPACDGSDCNGSVGSVLYKNINVPSMRKNKIGKTILVDASSSFWQGSKIEFENIVASFVEPASFNTQTAIRGITIFASGSMTLFEGTCPQITNLNVTWLAGTGNIGCDTSKVLH